MSRVPVVPTGWSATLQIHGIVQMPANDAREIESYLAAVREAGLQAHDVEIRKADLEDVFVQVMASHPDGVADTTA